MSIDAARLRVTIPFFREIAPDVLDNIIPFMYEKTYKKGSIIFFEGDEGDEIYFIRSGAVNIYSFDGVKKVFSPSCRKAIILARWRSSSRGSTVPQPRSRRR